MITATASSRAAPSPLASLCLLTAVCAAFGVFRLVLSKVVATPSNADAPSIRSAAPAGLKAGYELLQAEGYRVGTWNASFATLPSTSGTVLVVTLPVQQPISGREQQELRNWVQHGGTLIAFLSPPGATALLSSAPAGVSLVAGAGYATTEVAPPTSDPYRFGSLAPVSAGRLELAMHSPWMPIYADRGGVLVAAARAGKGRLMAVADGAMISNRVIADGNNALLLVHAGRVLQYSRTSRILFDEYHHRRPATPAIPELGMWRLAPPWLKYLVVALALVGMLALASAQSAIPPVRATAPRVQNPAADYAEELARWYQRSDAQTWALKALDLHYFRRTSAAADMTTGTLGGTLLERAVVLHTRWKEGVGA